MKPGVRKVALTAHVACSVGWLGAVAAFLALAISGLASPDAATVRGACVSMELTTSFVIVPLAFASLVTGLVVSLGTAWGLFRHYWIVAKLLITVIATILLLVHTPPIRLLATTAREGMLSGHEVGQLQIHLLRDAGAAALALLVNVALSVFKPWGLTRYGQRKQQQRPAVSPADLASRLEPAIELRVKPAAATPRWVYVVGIHAVGLALLFLVAHRTGGAWNH